MLKKIFVFSLLHLLITMICFFISFNLDSLDNPNYVEPLGNKIAGFIFSILIQPILFILDSIGGAPNIIENIFFVLNSVLWGFLITHLYNRFKKRAIN